MPDDGELSIEVRDRRVWGWTGIALTRGIEVFPSSFEISLTEKYPFAIDLVIKPGDACKVYIGTSLVLTGFVDRYSSTIDAGNHDVVIQGRSKTSDLVDCSAYFGEQGQDIPGGNIYSISNIHTTENGNITITDLANALAKPFNIVVINFADDNPKPLPGFSINLGETPYDILTRVARYTGHLIMDNEYGHLILDRSGSTQMSSGFEQGKNVQAAQTMYNIDTRYSDYYVISQPVSSQANINVDIQVKHARDPENIRFRPLYIVSSLYGSQQGDGAELAQQEAQWQANRNWGRSQAISLTVDSWRDSASNLWRSNALATVNMPIVKTSNQTWIIAQVTFKRDLSSGTSADLVLMPQKAFDIEPILLQQPLPGNLQQSPPAADPTPAAKQGTPAANEGSGQGPAGGSQGYAGVQGLPGSPSGPPVQR